METNPETTQPTPKEETKAEAKTEVNQTAGDLRARLKALTEKKEPSKPADKPAAKSFYDNDDDFVPAPKKEEPKPAAAEEKPSTKATTKMKEASANSIIGIVDITNRLFIPVHNRKFRKKFSDDEIKKLDKLQYKEKEDLTEPDDLALQKKFEKLIKRHTKKLDAIPLTEPEKTDLRTQLIAYMDYKEKVLPPEIGMVFTFVNILGSRIIDVVTE